MKILAIDDQPIILKSISHKLAKSDFEVITAESGSEGVSKFIQHTPDLVILDLNMPDMDGFEVIDKLRIEVGTQVPIIIMSGVDDEAKIVEAFSMGVDDYIQKPVGINEVVVRVKRLLKIPMKPIKGTDIAPKSTIHKNVTAVIIPCYNEELRLKSADFTEFAQSNHGYKLCFVNDGSKDNTLEVLKGLQKGHEDYITVYDCPKNGGKAEAVRQGINFMLKDTEVDYVGFLDADLSTNFADFEDLVSTISQSDYQIVSGSRMARMGANIAKESSRQIISVTINKIIQRILGMPFNDTQCGAKIFTRDAAEYAFEKKFLTSWIFDVEIFLRMREKYGKENVQKYLCEQPLKRWVHEDGSKLSMKDSIKIVFQLGQIALNYR